MAHLISPIMIEGNELCCDPDTKRTEVILLDAATEISSDEWELFRATAYGDEESNEEAESTETISGSVVFGVCCASTVSIELSGNIETLNTGYDRVEVRLNGERKFYFESTETTEEPWDTIAVGPFNVTLSLEDRPCGHIIEIDGTTGDEIANNDVWWRAKLVTIS